MVQKEEEAKCAIKDNARKRQVRDERGIEASKKRNERHTGAGKRE